MEEENAEAMSASAPEPTVPPTKGPNRYSATDSGS